MTVKSALKAHSRFHRIAVDPGASAVLARPVQSSLEESGRRASHRAYALPLTLVAILVQRELSLDLPTQVALMTCVVATLGVPHGALDDLLALPFLPARWGLARLPVFVSAYLTVAALVIIAWLWAPIPSLMTFLALSVIHFGSGDAPPTPGGATRAVAIGSRGLLPILLPPLMYPAPVAEIFGWLVGAPVAASSVSEVAATVLPLAVIIWGAEIIRLVGTRRGVFDAMSELSDLGVLGLLFTLTPPLFSFAVYFGFWHSTRHILDIAERLPDDPNRGKARMFVTLAAPLTLATLLMAGVAVLGLTLRGVDLPQGTATVVFIGLAALTVPHMLLTAFNQEGELGHRPAVLDT